MAITDDEGFFTISDVPSNSKYDLVIMRGTDVITLESASVLPRETTIIETKHLVSSSFSSVASIIWKGYLDTPPTNPKTYWSYHNTVDGKTYIYEGENWNLFVSDNKYIVSFQSNGGSRVSSQLIKLGDNVITPESPTKVGYTFDSWCFDKELTSSWDFDKDIILKDTTIYAKWTANSNTPYFVEYYQQDDNGDNYSKFETVEYEGVSDTNVAAIVKNYIGFSENARNINRLPFGIINADGTLVLKLYYDRNIYSLTFEENGGSSVSDQVGILYNTLSIAPENPKKDGYIFGGWYIDEECITAWDFIEDKILKDTILYAKWIARDDTSYTVEHYKQESVGDNYVIEEIENLKGSTDSLVSAIPNNYIGFIENTSSVSRIPTGIITIDEALVLKLYYDWTTFNVIFDEHVGSNVNDLSGIRYGTTINKPEDPDREGYTFKGWYTKEAGNIPWNFSEDIITMNTTIHANWIAKDDIIYTVEHYIEETDGDGYIKKDTETFKGSTDTIGTAVSKEYIGFIENTIILDRIPNGIITADGSLLLKLYYDWQTFSVEFEENGGSEVIDPSSSIRYGQTVSNPGIPTKKGYNFGGWYSDDTLDTLWDFENDVIVDDTFIYAKWIAQEHTLSFNPGYGGIGTMSSITVKTDEQITLPENLFTQDSHRFGGWYITLEEWIKYGDKAKFTMGSEDVTLTAGWYEYTLRGKGPAGGYIFYDDEEDGVDNIPGYRFIEAAPERWNGSDDPVVTWGVWGQTIGGTSSSVGSAITNTERIVSQMSGSYAANLCDSATISGYSDWVLPSIDELTLIKTVLKDSRLGGFSYFRYWSSTEQTNLTAWVHDMYTSKATAQKGDSYNYRIRPVRYFK